MESLRRSLRHEELKLLRHPSEKELESELTTKRTEEKVSTPQFEINDYSYFVKNLSALSLVNPQSAWGSEVRLGIMRIASTKSEEHQKNISAAQVNLHYNGDITVGMDTEQSYIQFGSGSAEYGGLTGKYIANRLREIEISEKLRQFQLTVVIVAYARKGSPEIVREPVFLLKRDVRS